MTRHNGDTRWEFDLAELRTLLERTPHVLSTLLRGLPHRWIHATEGDGTWSPFDVVGHLVHGERTDWMTRVRTILEYGEAKTFEPFDRQAQFEVSHSRTLDELLDSFAGLRSRNLDDLAHMALTEGDLGRTGQHPDFGRVTLGQLLASWVVHDWDHLMQIERVLALQYRDAVGPWRAYLRIVNGARNP